MYEKRFDKVKEARGTLTKIQNIQLRNGDKARIFYLVDKNTGNTINALVYYNIHMPLEPKLNKVYDFRYGVSQSGNTQYPEKYELLADDYDGTYFIKEYIEEPTVINNNCRNLKDMIEQEVQPTNIKKEVVSKEQRYIFELQNRNEDIDADICTLHDQFESWKRDNPNLKVVDIKYGIAGFDNGDIVSSLLIFAE